MLKNSVEQMWVLSTTPVCFPYVSVFEQYTTFRNLIIPSNHSVFTSVFDNPPLFVQCLLIIPPPLWTGQVRFFLIFLPLSHFDRFRCPPCALDRFRKAHGFFIQYSVQSTLKFTYLHIIFLDLCKLLPKLTKQVSEVTIPSKSPKKQHLKINSKEN